MHSLTFDLFALDSAVLGLLEVGVGVVLGDVQRLVDHLRDRLDLRAQLLLDLVQ